MPCINNTNGQPVPGRMGSCPVGSRWVMSKQDQQLMQENEGGGLQNIGDWITPGGAVKAGLGAAAASPFIKSGVNILKKKATDPNNLKKLQNLKNRLFKRFDEPVRPKYPLMNRYQQEAWKKANPGKWLFDKWKLAGWGGGTGLTLTQLMDQMGGDAPVSKVDTDPSSPTYKGGREARAGRGPAPEQSQMQRLGALMKDPNWWYESMSGLPSDNRLMRIGQLMSHYGKPTEKMRAQAGTPQEKWAENEAAAAKIKADMLTAGGTAGDIYGKKSIADLTEDLLPDVKQMFGDSFWRLTDNPDMDDEAAMLSLASQVATNIKAITTRFPNKTPNEVRQLALKQLMKDRGLTQYGL